MTEQFSQKQVLIVREGELGKNDAYHFNKRWGREFLFVPVQTVSEAEAYMRAHIVHLFIIGITEIDWQKIQETFREEKVIVYTANVDITFEYIQNSPVTCVDSSGSPDLLYDALIRKSSALYPDATE